MSGPAKLPLFWLRHAAWGVGLLAVLRLGAAAAPTLPDYQPAAPVQGTIRIWGHDAMAGVVALWAEGFQRFHPGAKVEANLLGSATAMPGLYAGRADLALLGRENNLTDDNGFGRVKLYAPRRFELMTGSLAAEGKSPALVVFVHRDNPLAHLTLKQLDGIFSTELRRGAAPLRTWGQLGLTGAWVDQPIHLYGYDAETGTGIFFAKAVLGGSRKLVWDNFREFKNSRTSGGTALPASRQILAALREDPLGLAVATLRYADGGVKALPLAGDDQGPFVAATPETLVSRAYPLARRTYAFVDQPPGRPLDPKVKEFLHYVFSRQGQDDIRRDRGYLPLPSEVAVEQLRQLEQAP